jgi:hypothetical protein
MAHGTSLGSIFSSAHAVVAVCCTQHGPSAFVAVLWSCRKTVRTKMGRQQCHCWTAVMGVISCRRVCALNGSHAAVQPDCFLCGTTFCWPVLLLWYQASLVTLTGPHHRRWASACSTTTCVSNTPVRGALNTLCCVNLQLGQHAVLESGSKISKCTVLSRQLHQAPVAPPKATKSVSSCYT